MKYGIRSLWFWLSLLSLSLLCLFIVYPLLTLVLGSKTGWVRLLQEPKYLEGVKNSLLLASAVTLSTSLIGIPLAFFTARYSFKFKAILAMLPLLTLIIPEVIVAQTWLMMLGNNGLITRTLRDYGITLPSFYGWFGLITVLTFTYYSYAYIGTLAAIKAFDRQLQEAGESLGVTPFIARLKIMLPVISPAIFASSLLVFTFCLGNFAVSSILGQRIPLLSVLTYQAALAEGNADPVMQSTLASLSILIVMVVLLIQRTIINRKKFEVVQGRGIIPEPLNGLKGIVIRIFALLVLTLSLLPVLSVIIGAFTFARGPVMQWGRFTTANIERMLLYASQPLVNSLTYALTATLLSIAFTTLVSYLIVKKKTVLSPALDYLTALPLALSGTAIGIGLLVAFNGSWLPITGTAGVIIASYIIRRLPFGIRNSSSLLHNIPNSIEEAAVSLGVSPLKAFIKVVLPILKPAILASAVLTWVTSVSELSASIIVYSGGRETLPIQIYRLIESGLMAQASAYGLALIIVVLIPIIIGVSLFKIELK